MPTYTVISQSPNITDPADLQKYYANLSNISDTYHTNIKSFLAFHLTRAWSRIHLPVDHNH